MASHQKSFESFPGSSKYCLLILKFKDQYLQSSFSDCSRFFIYGRRLRLFLEFCAFKGFFITLCQYFITGYNHQAIPPIPYKYLYISIIINCLLFLQSVVSIFTMELANFYRPDNIYSRGHHQLLFLLEAVLICSCSLFSIYFMSFASLPHYCSMIELYFLLYALCPIPSILVPISITVSISIIESLNYWIRSLNRRIGDVIIIILLHTVCNAFGFCVNFFEQCTCRTTFWNIGNNIFQSKLTLTECKIFLNLIDSIMPSTISSQVLKDIDCFRQSMRSAPSTIVEISGLQTQQANNNPKSADQLHKSSISSLGYNVFRPFVVTRMSNVSILFADIVGFTELADTKSASMVVNILDNLYARFDELCNKHGCEKISTLGDCYYCVSGCPIARVDHADCCVEMGLAMIEEIIAFDIKYNEEVQMRVGVHTGFVNCGIIGIHKFKFDIFSNDVTLANKMESSGRAGYVHITESTFNHLHSTDHFNVTESEEIEYLNTVYKTYLINRTQFDQSNNLSSGRHSRCFSAHKSEEQKTSQDDDKLTRNDDMLLLQRFMNTETSSKSDPPIVSLNVKSLKQFLPKVNKVTLSFKDSALEHKYKDAFRLAQNVVSTIEGTNLRLSYYYANVKGSILISVICMLMCYIALAYSFITASSNTLKNLIYVLTTLISVLTLAFAVSFGSILNSSAYKYRIAYILQIVPLIYWTTCCFIPYPNRNLITFRFAGLTTLLNLCFLFPQSYSFIKISMALCQCVVVLVFEWKLHINFITIVQQIASVLCLFVAFVICVRERERTFRILYHAEEQGRQSYRKSISEKDCANWLIRNILPSFAIDLLLNSGLHYAQDYEVVGVSFITLTNYLTDLYEEQFEGGQFYGRILNELYADIDNLLSDDKFNNHIEKIKTIGPTYMVASGLATSFSSCERIHKDNHSNNLDFAKDHLISLMEFVKAFMELADQFSASLFHFKFVVRAGYNFGPVTAGVLGNSRINFDIWGDTVNVASRMDSKGVNGRIQVPEHVATFLTNYGYEFEPRGPVHIKGKNVMDVYLLKI
ncbi:hypothetical protein GJ496_001936 [Pomphorhynchus laevis]|nr:hypothetical protein GJ496_001936 [Pomphorhynchus laevis]